MSRSLLSVERWNLVWVLETSPDVLYILIFLAVVWLWRPKTNSKRYALYEQAGVTADEVDGLDFSDEDDEYLPDELDEDEGTPLCATLQTSPN